MGNLILCHDKHATHPYEITRIHCRIFTIEELCYYLCNNLYLIDYTIMNEQLCTWIEEEIGMAALADSLRDVLRLRFNRLRVGQGQGNRLAAAQLVLFVGRAAVHRDPAFLHQ